MILGKKVTIADLEGVDEALHRGLTWMLSVPTLISFTFRY